KETEEQFLGSQLANAANSATAEEFRADPHDLIANLLLHDTSPPRLRDDVVPRGLHASAQRREDCYHRRGHHRIAEGPPLGNRNAHGVLGLPGYELITQPSIAVLVLTVTDLLIMLLTWRESCQGRTLRETWP